jgi:hypothetical protein
METDLNENIGKIIAAKTKQIKIEGEKYEGLIKTEIKRIITLQNEIKHLEFNNDVYKLNENHINEQIKLKEFEIKEIRQIIKKLTLQKREALGCNINIGFNDDLIFKQDLFD